MHSRFVLAFLAAGLSAAAQTGGATVGPVGGYTATPDKNPAETKTQEEPATFRTRVNLVMVPVVVRDKHDQAIGGLKQEDFRLADRGKPQEIIKFSIETPTRPPVYRSESRDQPASGGEAGAELLNLPNRFVAYVFDDIHTNFADMVRVRDAAIRHLAGLGVKDRAAVYTLSGQVAQEFTDDRDLLNAAIKKILPHPIARGGGTQCPDISYYQADLIVNKNDTMALQAAVSEVQSCQAMTDPSQLADAQNYARSTAQQMLSAGEQETHVALYSIRELVRRMAAMPGQRLIVLASPGFITPTQQEDKTEILDRAIKANVVIGALDARGLYTDTQDISKPVYTTASLNLKQQYDREAARAQADVLAELSTGTGGSFFENNNDLYAGFQRVAAAPEYVYMLGFSPQNLKLDGSFHSLKVTLKPGLGAGLSIQSRKGFYSPRHLADPKETAKEEISEALFSREETTDLPVAMLTQYFKSSAMNARVSVVMRVDAKRLKFRRENDRNCNELTIVAALFDRNGNYVVGVQKRLDMKLKDDTLAKRLDNGLTVRSSFDVKPGAYMVRLVVRDTEAQLMSATNGALDIR